MKRLLSVLLSLLTVSLSLVGCGVREVGEHLTFYCLESEKTFYQTLFNGYNSYCLADDDRGTQAQVGFVTFENENELNAKLSAELMSGGGPDVMLTGQRLPFEKMMNAERFADLDKLLEEIGEKIDLDNYEEKVMEAGVWNGKRYILPVTFSVRTIFGERKLLKELGYSEKAGSAFTYSDSDKLDSLLKSKDGYLLYRGGYVDPSAMIGDFVDFKNKTFDFDTDEFRNALESFKKLSEYTKSKTEKVEDVYTIPSVFTTVSYGAMQVAWMFCNSDENHDGGAKEYTVYKGMQRKAEDVIANVELGVLINKNTANPKACAHLVNYMLSEVAQNRFTNPNGQSDVGGMPVNKKSFVRRLRDVTEFEGDYSFSIDKLDPLLVDYIDIAQSVTACDIYDHYSPTYYETNVIGRPLEKYLRGEIGIDKFIRQLSSATKLYMEE